MYALSYRSSFGRRAARSFDHFARFESHTSHATDPTQNITTASGKSLPTWDSVVIPSREEILQKPKKSLSHFEQGKNLTVTATPRQPLNPQRPSHESDSEGVKRRSHIAEITAQRKAERLERERLSAARNKPAATVTPTHEAFNPFSSSNESDPEKAAKEKDLRIAEFAAQRGAERMAREAAQAKALSRSMANSDSPPRAAGQRGRRSSKPLPIHAKKVTSNVGHSTVVPTAPVVLSTDSDDPLRSQDITLEILENGGDNKTPAEFTSPDLPFTNLDDMFGPSFETQLEKATNVQTQLPEPQAEWLRETYGGDYHRFASRDRRDYITKAPNLGPLRHIQVVMSKRRDVPVGARKDAAAIIASIVGEAGSKMAQIT